jgi:hypothetical protein
MVTSSFTTSASPDDGAVSQPARVGDGPESRRRRSRTALLLLIGGVAFTGGLWLIWAALTPPAVSERVLDVEAVQAAIRNSALSDESPEARGARFRELWQSMRDLTDEERKQLEERNGNFFSSMEVAQAEKYTQLSPEERTAVLNREIDQMLAMQQAMRSRRERGAGPPGGGNRPEGERGNRERGPGGGERGPGRRGDGPGAGGGRAGGGAGGGGGGRGQNREERQRSRLDNSTPESRAAVAQYRYDMRQQMLARGVTPPTFGRR